MASAADLKKNDLVMFPTVITGVVPIVDLAKVGPYQMHLTGDVLGRVFAGQITQWDAPEIKALNPALKLPVDPIRLVARGDGSGTTYHFSDYLARPALRGRPGTASPATSSGRPARWPSRAAAKSPRPCGPPKTRSATSTTTTSSTTTSPASR